VPKDVDAIEAIEDQTSTFKWVHRVSKKFGAWVQCGFVERHSDGKLYNSLVLMNAAYREMHIIRKVYLYEADKSWSQPESCISGVENNFRCFDLRLPSSGRTVKVGSGVCMDINWKDFKEGHSHEKFLADFQVANGTQLLLWSTAWVIEGQADIDFFKGKLDQLSLYNINYWAERL
jgi:predicted amidohydrolase